MHADTAVLINSNLLTAYALLALLISNTAGSLARRLAGSLALAAAAVLETLLKIACIDRLDSLHDKIPLFLLF